MDTLWEHLLEVDGTRFPASAPERGDARSEYDNEMPLDRHVTVGVQAVSLPKLLNTEGHTGRLLDLQGRELMRFQIEKVDARASTILGSVSA
jgi:hypothetical protein